MQLRSWLGTQSAGLSLRSALPLSGTGWTWPGEAKPSRCSKSRQRLSSAPFRRTREDQESEATEMNPTPQRNLDVEGLRAQHALMHRIRAFEEVALRALDDKLVLGAIHPSIGQEAI